MLKDCDFLDFNCYQYNLIVVLQSWGMSILKLFLDSVVSITSLIPAPTFLDALPTINIPQTISWVLTITNAELGFNLIMGAMIWRFIFKIVTGR